MTLRHVTPLVSSLPSLSNEASIVARQNDDGDSPFGTTTTTMVKIPTQVLQCIQGMRFPYRLLAMLWYIEQTSQDGIHPWLRWTDDGKVFSFPSPEQAQDKTFKTMLKSFFNKRFDLVIRSCSEWGFRISIDGTYVS